MTSHLDPSSTAPSWDAAPNNFHWCAQDENGDWYWYSVEPEPSIGGGVWRSNSRHQQFACHGPVNPDWIHSLRTRHSHAST